MDCFSNIITYFLCQYLKEGGPEMTDSSLNMSDYKNPVHDHFPLSLEIDILETYTIHVGRFELGFQILDQCVVLTQGLLLVLSFFLEYHCY